MITYTVIIALNNNAAEQVRKLLCLLPDSLARSTSAEPGETAYEEMNDFIEYVLKITSGSSGT